MIQAHLRIGSTNVRRPKEKREPEFSYINGVSKSQFIYLFRLTSLWMDSVAERGKKRPRSRAALSFFFPVLSLLGKVSSSSVPSSYSKHIFFDLYLIYAILIRHVCAHAINDALPNGMSVIVTTIKYPEELRCVPSWKIIGAIYMLAGIYTYKIYYI